MSVQVKLPFIKNTKKFLSEESGKVLAQIAADTIDEITTNFSKGKTGAGRSMPKLSSGYQSYKMNETGRGKRDLFGPGRKATKKNPGSIGGAMLASLKAVKDGDGYEIAFGADEIDKARGNQDAISKKGGGRFMSVSKKWIASMVDYYLRRMRIKI